MITWKPLLTKPLKFPKYQAKKEYNRKRIILFLIGFSGLALAFIIPTDSLLFLPILIVAILIFFYFYIRFRSFIISYLSTYGGREWKLYAQDYSWKDSLVIGSLLVLGLVSLYLLIFRYLVSQPYFLDLLDDLSNNS